MPQTDHCPATRARVARRLGFVVLLGVALLLAGCVSRTTTKAKSVKSVKNLESSAAELSARNHSLLGRYSAQIETAADKVIFESVSPDARRQALVWKAEAIPVLQQTLLNLDPVAAVFDTWVFLFQMTEYMERPAIKQRFGESYPEVAETLKQLESEMQELVLEAAPSAHQAALRQKAASWAEAHPVRGSLAGRQSVAPERIRELGESDLGAMASIKTLTESLGDLTARLDSYSAYLPKQARWQTELLLNDLARSPTFGATRSNFATVSDALAKTSSSIEKMPELIGQADKAVANQRLAVQDFLQYERLQLFNSMDQQRVALLSAVDRQRQEVTADLSGERQIVLEALHSEREAAINDVRSAGDRALQDFDARARGLINHFFWRALELMLITLALCAVAVWLLLRRFARRRPDRGQVLYDRAA